MREATKRFVIEVRTPPDDDVEGILAFEYGMLSPKDRDHVQDTGVTAKSPRGGGEEVDVDSNAIVRETLDRGLRDGPEGFSLTKQDIVDFMESFPDHSEQLAEAIQNFSEMQPEVRKTFRQAGTGETGDAGQGMDAAGGG